MENAGLPTVGCYATNNTGVVGVSMEMFNYGCLAVTRVLHSNDGIRPDTSQYSSKMSFDFSWTTWYYTPEDITLQNYLQIWHQLC
jgi:hypothetical protein